MKFVWIIIGMGSGFIAGICRKKILCFLERILCQKKQHPIEAEVAQNDDSKELLSKTLSDRDAAIHQFLAVQDKFYGIFEALYQAAQGPQDGIDEYIADWSTRMTYIDSCPDLKVLWNNSKDNLSCFLEFLYSCGVQRDAETEITADATTHYFYVEFDGKDIMIGEKYKVMLPFWHNAEVVLEKGIIKHTV